MNHCVVRHRRTNRDCRDLQSSGGLSCFCRLYGWRSGLTEGPTGPTSQVSSCASPHPSVSPPPTDTASLGGTSCYHSHITVQHTGCNFTGFTHGKLEGLLLCQARLLPMVLFKKLFLPCLNLLLFLHFLPETHLHLVGKFTLGQPFFPALRSVGEKLIVES